MSDTTHHANIGDEELRGHPDQLERDDEPGLQGKTKRFKDDPEFQKYVADNQWSNRREKGYPWRMSAIEYIREVYAPWLGQGLLQGDLLNLDAKLYVKLHHELYAMEKEVPGSKEAAVADLGLPAEKDAALDSIDDENQRIGQEYLRKRWREDRRTWRAGLSVK